MAKKNADRYIFVKKGSSYLGVDTIGAQIVSWVVDGLEVMYQGALDSQPGSRKVEPAWKATAKNLFPNPGPMGTENDRFGEPILDENGKWAGKYKLPKDGKNVTYVHNGGLYTMGQHGFAQTEEYKVLSKVEFDERTGRYTAAGSNVVMTITDELNDTLDKYPYKFAHSLVYELGTPLSLKYEAHAQNNDNKPMVAGQGWHPAFKLHGKPSNYRIVITNLVKKPKANCELTEGQMIDIDSEVISGGKTLHFGGIKSVDVTLLYKKPSGEIIEYLTMHTAEPELILWSKAATEAGQENFICIEPWNTPSRMVSQLTTQDKTAKLAKKGAVVVSPAMSAAEKQDIIDYVEQERKLSPIEKQCLLEHLQVEDSVLRASVTVCPEYVRYFAPVKEGYKTLDREDFGEFDR